MSTSDKICDVGASKSNDDGGVCELEEKLQKMSTDDKVSICANCGKTDISDNMNTCNKCNQVKYCNAACKKKHRTKHKKHCERLIANKHDEELFKEPPPLHEDCPICFLRMPSHQSGWRYMTCCGKIICCGCIHTGGIRTGLCPFCRTESPKSVKEAAKRNKKRVEAEDSHAIYSLGCCYDEGTNGYPQDHEKAFELWQSSGKLGHPLANYNLGYAYSNGRVVEVDKKKANYYYELAAMRGDAYARHNLGNMEGREGNLERALKHFMVAVKGGHDTALNTIKVMYLHGDATKEDYTEALRAYQSYLAEVKSIQRDKAAAFSDEYRYY